MPDHGSGIPAGKEKPVPNHLIRESSPYLLQHAYNPVEWYPWGDEAFQLARELDRPVFLSIGYSTCHWCHVMAHESFEDTEVAALLNRSFVCIKVDREERPDIDALYMSVAQALTGTGGWPLTIVMTPEREPFFAATYIPKESRFGSKGLLYLLPSIEIYWKTHREEVRNTVGKIRQVLFDDQNGGGDQEATEMILHAAFRDLSLRFDPANGGFSDAPKFPAPHTISFLLRYWKRTGEENALKMAETTLISMSNGGIYDHIGYGFHRYSTDSRWLVPHFEKMLYDQALLIIAYTEAYTATGVRSYRVTAEECLTYLLRDMRDSAGGFYSAEDADSEGVEGKFYLWKKQEIGDILGGDALVFFRAYNVKAGGNFITHETGRRTGENILHLSVLRDQLSSNIGIPDDQMQRVLDRGRERLFIAREARVRPFKDDKVLTDWNGLVISALSIAGRAFGDTRYVVAAKEAAEFVLNNLLSGTGELCHRYRDGKTGIRGLASDYVYFCSGLLDLYELTGEARYLGAAIRTEEYLTRHFLDTRRGGYFTTHDEVTGLPARQREIYDGALPSANSIAMKNLLRLGLMTSIPDYHVRARDLARSFSGLVAASPTGYTAYLSSLDFALGPAASIVIVGDEGDEETVRLKKTINSRFLPSVVLLHRPGHEDIAEIDRISGFTGSMRENGGKATAYICVNNSCTLPMTDHASIITELENMGKKPDSGFG